ncbi:gp667 [Bacillus phage G]|uniref:Gp667 n=1 Tax=Bacillus phage G TaxID=2884420 RepID=G3MB47_9CAUD|nr:gp667 [Bacillus phage G]AEO93910.1 gp667 [Bacillus phage G]
MNLTEKLIKGFDFHQANYNLTCDGKYELDQSNTIDLRFGNLEEDGFKVLISVFVIDGSLSKIIVSDYSNYIETREQNILEDFLYHTGYFMDFLHESQDKLEDKLEKSYVGKLKPKGK